MEIPDMLFGKILRSQVSHASIRRIDTSAALALPGVKVVIAGRDLQGIDPCLYGLGSHSQ